MTGRELRAARESLGLSQQALADGLGVEVRSVHRWEHSELPARFSPEAARLVLRLHAAMERTAMDTKYPNGIDAFQVVRTTGLSHLDLAREVANAALEGQPVEAYRVEVTGRDGYLMNGETMEVVFFPSIFRGGVAWGGDALWTDARSAEEVVELYLTDEMVP